MRSAKVFSSFVAGFLVVLMYGFCFADEADINGSKALVVVPVKSGSVDQGVYRQVDRIVPELKKLYKNQSIKLECRYSGQPGRERDVQNAYMLAARIEKYLRVRHKLKLDMWVAIDIAPQPRNNSPVLTIAVLPDEVKNLNAVPVDPSKNDPN